MSSNWVDRPMRGKDEPLKALEALLPVAKEAVAKAEDERRMASYALKASEKRLALARRDVQDVQRAIQAVRALETEPLVDYQKAVRGEAVDPS